METIRRITLILIIIGALNWGLIGLFNLNLVTMLIKNAFINNVIYIIIGISALTYLSLLLHRKMTH